MNKQLKEYYANLKSPWSELFYDTIGKQLGNIENQKILDFGSGFGVLSNILAENNTVIALEPNTEMVKNRRRDNEYIQLTGGLERLEELENDSFDVIICHNVLEYASHRVEILSEFSRILKHNGFLSVVKHNHYGRIMQKIVYENKVDDAISILSGGESTSVSFGKINYYDNCDIEKWQNDFYLDKIFGVRTFFALQSNDVKYDCEWKEKMLKAELAVCEIDDFAKISFFNHLIFKKH